MVQCARIKRGLAPSPTCLPGQGGTKNPVLQADSDAAERQRSGFVSFLGVPVARTASTSGAFLSVDSVENRVRCCCAEW